jgi:hypothetical protein
MLLHYGTPARKTHIGPTANGQHYRRSEGMLLHGTLRA